MGLVKVPLYLCVTSNLLAKETSLETKRTAVSKVELLNARQECLLEEVKSGRLVEVF